MFVPGKPFQPNIRFKVRPEPIRVVKVLHLALTTDYRLKWRGLPRTNTIIAYYEHLYITDVKCFIRLRPDRSRAALRRCCCCCRCCSCSCPCWSRPQLVTTTSNSPTCIFHRWTKLKQTTVRWSMVVSINKIVSQFHLWLLLIYPFCNKAGRLNEGGQT